VENSKSTQYSQMNQQQPHQGQKRILAVDDEPDITRLCSLTLEYYGFKVDTFNIQRKHYQTLSQTITIWLL
jgi:DNA-binding response OmpR family regulator